MVHDVEVNYFTCGFTCHFFLLVFNLYAYVFTCATSKLFSQVKLHVKPQVIYFNVVWGWWGGYETLWNGEGGGNYCLICFLNSRRSRKKSKIDLKYNNPLVNSVPWYRGGHSNHAVPLIHFVCI